MKKAFVEAQDGGGEIRHPQPVHRRGRAQRRRRSERRKPASTRRSTSGRCRRIGWSCGRGWRAAGSDDTVPREFYKERDVVMEERRMRTDSNPIGRLVEQFLATAYVAHNYGRSGIGWPSEVSQINATEAMAFHKKYYVGVEYRGRRRGRREGQRGSADAGEVFQPGSRRAQARGDDHRRAQAVCREDGGHSRADAAVLYRGLSPARLSRPRRCGLRRDQRHHVQRPRFAPLSQPGARPADCRRGRGLQPLPRRKVSRPVRLLCRSAAGPHAGSRCATPSTRRSTS